MPRFNPNVVASAATASVMALSVSLLVFAAATFPATSGLVA